jgi:hypothetical protein
VFTAISSLFHTPFPAKFFTPPPLSLSALIAPQTLIFYSMPFVSLVAVSRLLFPPDELSN